jgi:hypothetical protein
MKFISYKTRTSTIETQADDEHEQTMTHSLIIAHQCTVETLERLEDGPSPPLTPGASSIARTLKTPTRYKPSRSFDSQKSQWPLCSPDIGRKRASVWINDLIFETASLPPGFRRHTWVTQNAWSFWTSSNITSFENGQIKEKTWTKSTKGSLNHFYISQRGKATIIIPIINLQIQHLLFSQRVHIPIVSTRSRMEWLIRAGIPMLVRVLLS